MADIQALKQFIDTLKGERSATSGITGYTSHVQLQAQQLRQSFAHWYIDQRNESAKQEFEKNLLLAHTFGVISDSELAACEQHLKD